MIEIMAISSEFHAYNFIKKELESLNWKAYNPTRRDDGEVYTQNECLQNELIKKYFTSYEKPENVVIVRNNKFWVIEAKPLHKDMDRAIKEAKEYADKLNKDNLYAPLISAVAGNDEDRYLISSFYFHQGSWKPITANGKVLTGLLAKEMAHYLVDKDTYFIQDFVIPEDIYQKKAEKINEILHRGAINKNNRARVMAALLLALSEDTPLSLDNKASVLIQEINAKVDDVLYQNKKKEFAGSIHITTPPTPDNHAKFRKSIVQTVQELEGLNIRSAMNSGTDVLGSFYEVFLKYGNGAKEIGIVLTPRHITKFGVDAISVNKNDIVFDPACGTGGFLVAAFDEVRKHVDEEQLNKFKDNNIHGIEQEPEVVALALVNMIFRGDGKNNIVDGNCFVKRIPLKATKVLMNPPFALKEDDEKETRFVDNALEQMEDGGLMFVILPSTIMFKGGPSKVWRKTLLDKNSLKAVIKLPQDLFYPIGVHTSAIIIQKGVPHDREENVFWGYLDDGFAKKKGIMKSVNDGNKNLMLSSVRDFLNNSSNLTPSLPKQYILSPVLFDTDLECAPEYYLKEKKHTDEEVRISIHQALNNLFIYLFNNPFMSKHLAFDISKKIDGLDTNLDGIFEILNGQSSNIEDYGEGETPFVTSTELNNGVEKYIEPDKKSLILDMPCVCVSSFGFATVQVPSFVARSHGAVIVLKPRKPMGLLELSYYAGQINLQKWRFSYGRWVTKKRLLKLELANKDEVSLPSQTEVHSLIKNKFNKAQTILFHE